MDKFPIEPNDCLILKAFKDSSSLREAANLLRCDPAGLARRVQFISSEYGFLQKINNRWQVTSRGLDLVVWTESSIQTQKKILSGKSSLRLSSTMWFAEELLIPNLSKLIKLFDSNTSVLLSSPQNNFELSLIDGSVDFVIVCHPPETPEIEHRQINQEKWIIVAPASWKKDLKAKNANGLDLVKDRPFVRHKDINLDLFLPQKMQIIDSGVSIDNMIGIRSAVHEGLGWSLVPRILVSKYLKENRLIEIPYDIPMKDRNICVWWLRNNSQSKRQAAKICAWIKESCN